MRGTILDVIAGQATWASGNCDGFMLARWLGAGAVDHVIGDPPYDDTTHDRARTTVDGKASDAPIDFAPLPPVGTFAPSLISCAKRWVVLCCAFEQFGDYKRGCGNADHWIRSGLWVRTNGMQQISQDRPSQGGEGVAIMHGSASRKRWNRGGEHGTWTGPKDSDPRRMHPTKKPLWLMEALIRDFTDPGDLVFDPTMGEGTTGEAAIKLGRRFIGCEIADGIDKATGKHDPERDYFAAAVARLTRADALPRQTMLLGTDPAAKAPRAKTIDMFSSKP